MNEDHFYIFVVLSRLNQAPHDSLTIRSHRILPLQVPIGDLEEAWRSGPPCNTELSLETLRQGRLNFLTHFSFRRIY